MMILLRVISAFLLFTFFGFFYHFSASYLLPFLAVAARAFCCSFVRYCLLRHWSCENMEMLVASSAGSGVRCRVVVYLLENSISTFLTWHVLIATSIIICQSVERADRQRKRAGRDGESILLVRVHEDGKVIEGVYMSLNKWFWLLPVKYVYRSFKCSIVYISVPLHVNIYLSNFLLPENLWMASAQLFIQLINVLLTPISICDRLTLLYA